jgi:hypothetical protein
MFNSGTGEHWSCTAWRRCGRATELIFVGTVLGRMELRALAKAIGEGELDFDP